MPIKTMDINTFVQDLPSVSKEIYRPTRFSTEMGLLKQKMEEEL